MGESTNISWADKTFNPWIGCNKVSPACDGCYAENLMDKRYGRVKWGAPGQGVGTRSRTSEGNWHQPIRWNKAAGVAGTRPFVFCASLADVFDNQVPVEWRQDLFDLIRATPNLVWLLLTKRPQNIVKMAVESGGLPSNAAIGATVEDQERADINVLHLLAAKDALHPAFAFLSCEPLLGPIDITEYLPNKLWNDIPSWKQPEIDWVITGGETDQGDHKARPSNPQWFRSLRDQCAAAGVPYHHKQAGEWADVRDLGANSWTFTHEKAGVRYGRISRDNFTELKSERLFDGQSFPTEYPWNNTEGVGWGPGPCMVKVGKSRAGRSIDGVEHDARPDVDLPADLMTHGGLI